MSSCRAAPRWVVPARTLSWLAACVVVGGLGACQLVPGEDFGSALVLEWADAPARPWAGADVWTNRLQDWGVADGRLAALAALPFRTAHLLTVRGDPVGGPLVATMRLGLVMADAEGEAPLASRGAPDGDWDSVGAAGFLLGVGGPRLDPRRAALVHHSVGPGAGVFVGVDDLGFLRVADLGDGGRWLAISGTSVSLADSIGLELSVHEQEGRLLLDIEATPFAPGGEAVALTGVEIDGARATGGLALVSHGVGARSPRAWFSSVHVGGAGAGLHPEAALGPILGAQHTLSRGVLKLTAQLFPISAPAAGAGTPSADTVVLEVEEPAGVWREAARAPVIVPGYTATFAVPDWPSSREVPYRLAVVARSGDPGAATYTGTVRADPVDKDEIVVAAFTGNANVASPGVDRGSFDWQSSLWFPHEDLVAHVGKHDPDFLFFSGDQVYEGASPTSADFANPHLDYLYKWYLWLWAFRDLTRDLPAVTIPDDHDVFHGNVWGAGGRATPPGLTGAEAQDRGGYRLPAAWVNMVQRTQTAHLPDPADPDPVEQGIGVYFTDVLYGGVSFAVVEDRKFKSAPKPLLPDADVWNGWARNERWDASTQGDPPGAELLGARQERFLEQWAGDWSGGAWMKVLLSQTIFANVATIPADAANGSVIPTLAIPEPGVFIQGDKVAADMDSNGWPRSGRDRAVRAIRKGFAVHLAGDQHLASTVQYGVDAWGDASFALCVPSVANFWPRRWYPPNEGRNRSPDAPPYAGDHRDGFGNRMTVFAVSNPARWGRTPEALHDRAPGYGIARFNRVTREVSLAAWPRWSDPHAGEGPYPGWPVRFHQADGFGAPPWGRLATLVVEGVDEPVVQVRSERDGEIVYTIRSQGPTFTPWVLEPGFYTVRVGEPGTQRMQEITGLEASQSGGDTLRVDLTGG